MTEKYFDELPHSEIEVDEQLTLRQLHLDEAEQLFKLIDKDRDYLKKWLPWVDSTESPKDSEKFISDKICSYD